MTGPGGRRANRATAETLGQLRSPDPWRPQHPTTEHVDRSAGQGGWLAGFAALVGAMWPGTSITLGSAEIGSTRQVPPMARLGLPGGLAFDGAALSTWVELAAGLANGVVRLQPRAGHGPGSGDQIAPDSSSRT